MKKSQICLLTLFATSLYGCGQMNSETLNSSDTVSVVKNANDASDTSELSNENSTISDNNSNENSEADSLSSIEEVANQPVENIENNQQGEPVEVDPIAKLAIAKIEETKNILLTAQFVMMIVEETPDTVTINIRENQEDKVVNYGYFKYTKSTDTLEEMDEITGEYNVIS